MFDFSNYFDSIQHKLLFDILEKEYTDERTLNLIKHFIDMFGKCGLGLGSQVSQILALAAGNQLDHFIKEKLRIKCYGRYMDDGYLIHENKEYLLECLEKIQKKCEEIGLNLNAKKTVIVPIKRNFMWLKIRYRVTESGHIIKRVWKNSVVRMRRKLKRLKRKLERGEVNIRDITQSYKSWKSHTSGLHIYRTMVKMDTLFDSLFE